MTDYVPNLPSALTVNDRENQGAEENSSQAVASIRPLSDTRAELMTLTEPKALAAWLIRERSALQSYWSSERGGRAWMHEHSSLLDAMVRRLFTLSQEQEGDWDNGTLPGDNGTPGSVAILAVGGYGQRLLAPHSDLDLTFLSERDDNPRVLRRMFRLVMDVLLSGAKMKVGYAYRTLADVGGDTLDHQTQTALLDARHLTGDIGLFRRFQETFPARLGVADFLFRKEAERGKIRARHGGSAFIVDPNLKEGVGGIRDFQTAAWMARVRFGKSGEALWRDLVRRRVLTPKDWETLSAARELLLTLRCGLHVLAGERRDVLTAKRQEEIAARLGFVITEENGVLSGVEAFMHQYYAAAAAIERIADKVMLRCLDAPLPLGHHTGLSSVRRMVAITEPSRTDADPLWPLTAFEACQEHGLELATPTEEAIEQHIAEGRLGEPGSESYRAAGSRFLTLLLYPGDVGATLRRMRRTTLLRVLLPELDACMGLIPYDSTHTRTVGEHSLEVLNNLIRLRDTDFKTTATAAEENTETPYRHVLGALLSPLPLFLAALLHDTGKQWAHTLSGERAGHEVTGAERTEAICTRLGCSDTVTQQTVFLIRQHLLLAQVSRLRDLSLPSTIREVTRLTENQEQLRMLYLLTWADTHAVGPGVWTPMTARLLDELFARADEALGELSEENAQTENNPLLSDEASRLHSVRQRLQRQLTTSPASPEETQAHIAAMPAAYLLNTPPETISLHLTLIARLQENEGQGVMVDLRPGSVGTANAAETEMTVVTADAPGLFANITGALFACDIRLHSVQAFTRPLENGTNVVIDTLSVDYRGRPLGPEKRRAAEKALHLVLTGVETAEALIARQRRGAWSAMADISAPPPVRAVSVDDTTAPGFTLVDVETPDEIGVTYKLAACFARLGWNIHAARASTWGGNARCAFYLTDGSGDALDAVLVRERLASMLPLPVARQRQRV